MRHVPLLALLFAACAHRGPAPAGAAVASLLLAYDDGRAEGALTFPTLHHEGVVRFELPPGEHQLRRLWLQATAPGTIRWAIYEQTPLDGPGFVVSEGTFILSTKEVSSGHDSLWVYADLTALAPRDGVVWLGLKRTEGEPAIATSRVDAGQYYLRSDDPSNPLNLLPVKRTPLVRLEVAP